MAQFLADSLSQLTAPGAIIVSDQPINGDGWENLPLPDGIKPRRYFMQRVPG